MFDDSVQDVIDRVDQLRHEKSDAWQIPADEGQLLAQVVRLAGCVSLLEIGTSYGFSTLHLAGATQPLGGRVHTIDINPAKTEAATSHLAEADLLDVVTLHTGDARELPLGLKPSRPFDFAFIDATKDQSFGYLEALWPLLAERAVLVTDNTASHAEELAPFVAHLRSLPGVSSCHVAVGNGIEVTLKG